MAVNSDTIPRRTFCASIAQKAQHCIVPVTANVMNIWNESHSEAPPASDQQIVDAEIRLGVKFPEIFKSMLRVHNGGYPKYEMYVPPGHMIEYSGNIWPLGEIHSLDLVDTLKNLVESGWSENDTFEGQIEKPELLICFANQASRFWCFDYRETAMKCDPKIVFIDAGDDPPRECLLANECYSFFANLVENIS